MSTRASKLFFLLTLELIALLATPRVSSAQSSNAAAERFERELQQMRLDSISLQHPAVPPGERALFDYGGFLTVSYLSLDDLNQHNHSLWQYDLVGYADLNIDDVQELFVRGRLEWQEFGDGDAFDGRDHQYHAEIERAYYKLDIGRALSAYRGVNSDAQLAIKGGRQFVYWGNGLSLSQTLDGAILDAGYAKTHLQVLAGITPANTIDIDPTRPRFDSNTHRGFYGAMVTQDIGQHRPFLYFVAQQDYNHDYTNITGTGPTPITTHYDYDSNYLGIGSTGAINDHISYGFEGVYESGTTLSNSFDNSLAPVHQTENDIAAFAADVRLDYLLNDTDRSRLSGEFIVATGDSARRSTTNTLGGSPPDTTDGAFNGFGQVQNGIAFSPNVSNLLIFRLGGSTFPLRNINCFHDLQTGLDAYVFAKCDPAAPLDEPSRNRGYVGAEPDLFVNWQIKSDITLAMRYGLFFPGTAVLNNSVRQFFYTGLTLAF